MLMPKNIKLKVTGIKYDTLSSMGHGGGESVRPPPSAVVLTLYSKQTTGNPYLNLLPIPKFALL